MKWNNFKKSFQHNSMETRLADKQKHRLCSTFFKNIFMSSKKYPQQCGQGRENTSHKSWSGKTPPPFYLPAQSKFSTKQKWRNDQSNLYSFCNKQLQNDRPDCYFIRKNFELLKVTLNMAICSVGFVWLILS